MPAITPSLNPLPLELELDGGTTTEGGSRFTVVTLEDVAFTSADIPTSSAYV